MVTVRFYGDLKQFGTSFKMDVATVPEALRALMTQIQGLREHIEKGQYKVKADGKFLTEKTLSANLSTSLHITPVTTGAGKNGGIGQIIIGVVMIVASYFFPPAYAAYAASFAAMGAGMVLGGVAQLLTKMPSMDAMKDSDDLKSSSFSNLSNMAAQGAPVPIIYGEMMVGSKVLSQGVRSSYSGSAGDGSGDDSGGSSGGSKNIFVVMMEKRIKIPPKSVVTGGRFDSTNPSVINRNYTAAFIKEGDA